MRAVFEALGVLYTSAIKAFDVSSEHLHASNTALKGAVNEAAAAGLARQIEDRARARIAAAQAIRDWVLAVAGLIFGGATLLSAVLDIARFALGR